jgi:hypothetical protein
MSLERSPVPGDLAVWAHTLYRGPVPVDVDDATFRAVRTRYHAEDEVAPVAELRAMAERWDRGLERALDADEVVLWFEHDLHDQMLLIRHLDWFTRHLIPAEKLSLICIDRFPGVEPFYGLGQLDPEQLASLLDSRTPITGRQMTLGGAAWRAFTGPDPRAIEGIIEGDTRALPFLAHALRRVLEEFPATRSGLPRTERTILETLVETGRIRFADFFAVHQNSEAAPFMGDTTIWSCIEDLAGGQQQLVNVRQSKASSTTPNSFLAAELSITEAGRATLVGDMDWAQTAEFDRWIGGTHLVAPNIEWRWDAQRNHLVHRV